MAGTTVRRPLPALIALLALLLLTGIVWWRVVDRDNADHAATSCPTPTPTVTHQATLPAPASVSVQVVNSTTRSGLAGKVRTTLQQLGFQVPARATNDPIKKKNPQTAQIRFTPAGKQGATLLRYYFPGATLTATTGNSAVVTVALGDRYRSVASAQAVAAALKGDNLATATPTPTPAATTESAGC